MGASPDAGWWIFDGSTDELTLSGANAHVFDPEKNAGDFTVMGVLAPDSVSAGTGTLFSKWDETSSDRMWSIQQNDDDLLFRLSANGTTPVEVTRTSALAAATDAFFCGRYDKSATDMFLDVDGTESSNTSAPAAIHSSEAQIRIGNTTAAADDFYDGSTYWLAYWNRKLTDTEVDEIRLGAHPCHYAPDFYIDFHQTVGATYISEIPFDTSKWEFDVTGTPTRGGSTDPTLPDPVGLLTTQPHPRDVYEGGSVIEPGLPLWGVGFRTSQQKADAQKVGRINVNSTADVPPTFFHRTSTPRQSSLRRGLASLLRFSRKRGR